MRTFIPCATCRRHCKIAEKSCPFCGAKRLVAGAGIVALASLGVGWTADAPAPSLDSGAPDGAAQDAGDAAARNAELRREMQNIHPVYGAPAPPREGCW